MANSQQENAFSYLIPDTSSSPGFEGLMYGKKRITATKGTPFSQISISLEGNSLLWETVGHSMLNNGD